MGLVWWEGVDEDTRGSVRQSFRDDLTRRIASITIEGPPSDRGLATYSRNGVTYALNLPEVKRLRVQFAPDTMPGTTGSIASISRLGWKDGRHYIATAAPTQGR